MAPMNSLAGGPLHANEMGGPSPGTRYPSEGKTLGLLQVILVSLVGSGVLVLNTALLRRDNLWSLEWKTDKEGEKFSQATWRFWDDTAIAIARYLDWTHGPQKTSQDPASMDELATMYQELLTKETRKEGIRAHEFWRTLRERPFLRNRRPYVVPPLEDRGRAIVIAVGYRSLGGISPYFPIWMGVLIGIPLLLWIVFEFFAAGYPLVGLAFLFVSGLSPYLIESLTLPHSAVGFYLAGLLVLIAYAAYAVLGRSRSRLGFAARVLISALLFAVFALCRSGTVFLLPGFLLALLLAARRVFAPHMGLGASRPSKTKVPHYALVFLLVSAVFLLPYLWIRPTQHHEAWLSLWEGLADFGAERGYSWHDRDAKRFLQRAGGTPWPSPREFLPSHEAFFRRAVLEGVRSDPLWYAGILFKRAGATVSLNKLAPWGPLDGESIKPPLLHYKFTTPVDWLGIGNRKVELPISCFWLPSLALGLLWLRSRRSLSSAAGLRISRFASVMLCVALAALPLPVLVTTAAGMETEAFAFVHFLGLSFLIHEGAMWVLGKRTASVVVTGEPTKPRSPRP